MIDGSTEHDSSIKLPSLGNAEDPRVIEVADDYLRDLKAGRAWDHQRYTSRYPELANEITECIEGIDLLYTSIPGKTTCDDEVHGSSNVPSFEPTNPVGDFQIVRQIARGGMGIVYEAVQMSLGRRVALKVLPFAATIDPRHLQRFKIETQAAALLHHTNIVPIYAVGCERGIHFYAMQLIDGQSLATIIEELHRKGQSQRPDDHPDTTSEVGRPLAKQGSTIEVSTAITAGDSWVKETTVRRLARVMVQAASAMEHAHQSGVIHRDLKPANLLIEASGHVWITDFGLAQLQADNGITRSGDFLGTFRYMSPEQISGERILLDHRTDIYSLGATFYELLALTPVFPGQTYQELLFHILHHEARPLRDFNRAVPVELETIILKCLSKSPSDRYQTAAELAADIQRFLSHEPIRARPPTLFDRTRKWSRRHPAVIIAGILVMFLIAVGSLISNRLISAEKQRTVQALNREKLRAEEVERQFQQSRQAIDDLFQISEEELADRPFEGARRRILETVLTHYENFIEQRRGDPQSQHDLLTAQNKAKQILHNLGVMQRSMRMRLLERDAVQVDVGVTDNQKAELKLLWDRWHQDDKTAMRNDLPNDNEGARRARMLARAEERDRLMRDLLSPQQLARLKQIAIQWEGVTAFKDREVIEALGLTPDQRASIRDLERRGYAGDRFSPSLQTTTGPPSDLRFGGPPRSRPPGTPPMRPEGGQRGPDRNTGPGWANWSGRSRQDALKQVLALLTEEQNEKWHELAGAAFDGFEDSPPSGPPPFGSGPPRR